MSTADTLLKSLITAAEGVSTSERQAEARVKTNVYFNIDPKAAKAEALIAEIKDFETKIQGLRAAASASGHSSLIEVYDAALSVFEKWGSTKDAA